MENEIWDKVLTSIKTVINKQSFDMWLKDTKPLSLSNDIITVSVQDDVARRHISGNYSSIITSTLKDITNKNISCEFIPTNGHSYNKKSDVLDNTNKSISSTTAEKSDNIKNSYTLYPQYTFDNFIIGPNNQLAHAAAISISQSPASQYNPFFIYGGTGLGKTHLMQAIAHSIIKTKPYMKVVYVPSEQFINEFIMAIRTNTMSSFKINYRNVDILLIDDIHFIEKKEQMQEEFFHTFNTLHNNKKQIVISSDRPPKELSTLEERLRTRFEWGLLTDIQPPNLETREAILRSKAEREGINISNEVLNYIAKKIKSNIRALEAALIRLNVVSSLNNEEISIQLAKVHLKQHFDKATNINTNISDIMTKVAEKYNITVDDLTSKSRHSRFVQPRFIAMYITRKLTNFTTIDIGKEFGDRDHSTVVNAINNIEKLIKEDDEIKEVIDELLSELKN
ncbi:MAG: chromosomal replication initiator protein DnaA [Spirochaetota bacterium]|nr:chromosomal replication initiator protein DnaA [Spirochaetota bacterium]